ncbi:MAG: toxin co-regulated pilus biosynthesis Q family protein [Rickettsiales bacterium]|jgi:hypothetical protein|nr:toxin co-regulated pilus biosynthesis Q family protein [Rickettsiales bacterium]
MIQRIMVGVLAVFALAPALAFADADRSQLVWQSPDLGEDAGYGPELSMDALSAYDRPRPAPRARPFEPKSTVYRAPGLKVSNQIITSNWGDQYSFSGGADLMHGNNAPAGFNDNSAAKMPLLTQEMIEDDGGAALVMSVSDRKYDNRRAFDERDSVMIDGGNAPGITMDASAMSVDSDANAAGDGADVVRSWVVVSGKSLRQVLQEWSETAGWDLVWNTTREYPIAASAVFEGRFMDVSSALVRNFSRAAPVPYARFYKGNKVLVVSTLEDGENNGH